MNRGWFCKRACIFVMSGCTVWLAGLEQGRATERVLPKPTSKTLIVLKLDADTVLPIQTEFTEVPPTVHIKFPRQQIVGSLPEQALVQRGVVQSITTRYQDQAGNHPKRHIEALDLVLTAPYAYRVDSEAGRIVIEVEHPSTVASTAVEIGLKSGTVVAGPQQGWVSERFRAMQKALADATPTSVAFSLSGKTPFSVLGPTHTHTIQPIEAPKGEHKAIGNPPTDKWAPETIHPESPSLTIPWQLQAIAVLVLGGGLLWIVGNQARAYRSPRWQTLETPIKPSSALLLIDQLVWRTFERQDYQLIKTMELSRPQGILHIVLHGETKAALLCIGNGVFFEKQTVEQFVRVMRDVPVEKGILVAAGSFTVPAQRLAKAHQVTLIGRDQLMEILSTGASSEYVAKQLEAMQEQLKTAQETARQYADELEVMRRQRNEASWILGEERTKSASVETEIAVVSQQLKQHQEDLKRFQEEAASFRKRWEESQWYLGESRAYNQHLEGQWSVLQEELKQLRGIESERNGVEWRLGEEQAKRESLEQELTKLQEALRAAEDRGHSFEQQLSKLQGELDVFRTFGERRRTSRVVLEQASAQLGETEATFSGHPYDVSPHGIGLKTAQALPEATPLRLRLCLSDSQEPIESQVQVQWQHAEGDPLQYRSGCKFLDLSRKARARLKSLMTQI